MKYSLIILLLTLFPNLSCGKKKNKGNKEDPSPEPTPVVAPSSDILSIELNATFVKSSREKVELGTGFRIVMGTPVVISSSEDMPIFQAGEKTAAKMTFVQEEQTSCEIMMPKPVLSNDQIYFETSDSEDCHQLLTDIELSKNPKFLFSNLQTNKAERFIRVALLNLVGKE